MLQKVTNHATQRQTFVQIFKYKRKQMFTGDSTKRMRNCHAIIWKSVHLKKHLKTIKKGKKNKSNKTWFIPVKQKS